MQELLAGTVHHTKNIELSLCSVNFLFFFFFFAHCLRLGHTGRILVFITEEELFVLNSAIFLSALGRELGMAREVGQGGVAVIR